MVRHAPIHRRSGHSDIAICCGRNVLGSSPSTSVVPLSNQVTTLNHKRFKGFKMFSDGHSGLAIHMSVGSADALLPDNQVLDALLTSLGIPHDPLEVIPGGIHDPRTIFNIIGPTPFQFINAHFLEPPPPPTVIESQGATDLDQVGSNYFL